VVEEEDQGWRCGRGDSAEDSTIDVRWPLSPARTRSAGWPDAAPAFRGNVAVNSRVGRLHGV
jgi:hypothetical protein